MRTTSQFALALFLAITPASLYAQEQPALDEPVQAQEPAPEQPVIEAPVQAQEPAAPPPDTATDSAATEQPAAPVDGQIVMQDLDTLLVSGLIGASVHTPTDEWIGDVNDLIFDTKGAVSGIVIGVGGVMGIGEKEVAFELSKVTFMPTESRNTAKLILNATPEELAAAPTFKSASVQMLERQQEQMRLQSEQPQMDSQGLMAPGAEPAPQPQQ
jgi:hypothetical protein